MNRFYMRGRKLLAIAGLALLAILLAVPTAWAFEGRSGDVVVIKAGEVVDDDLYVGAGQFTLDGTVKGDLFVAGGTIVINGTVEGDLVAAGQSVVVNGTVKDDASIAGYALTVGGQVGDDLITAGFSLEDKSGSNVGGELLSVGYQALLAGDVAGDASLAGGAVEIAGSIGGDAKVDVGGAEPGQRMPPGFPYVFGPNVPSVPTVPIGLTIDEGARIGGNLNYTANAPAAIPGGVVAGKTNFTQYVSPEVEVRPEMRRPSPAMLVGRWIFHQVRYLITLLLVGAVMMWVVPGWTRKVAGIVQSKPLLSLGWGFVAIAAFVVAMLALIIATVVLAIAFGIVTLGELAGRFAALGGIVMGTTAFGFSIVWAYVTRIVISLLLGQLIFRLFKSPAARHRWWPMLLGVVVLVAITAVPVLGWLATAATVLLGLGAVWMWGVDWMRERGWLKSAGAAPATAEAETSDVPPAE